MKSTRAYAHTNIALIKYWGKLPGDLNLPATGSLSLTLQDFGTQTDLSFIEGDKDIFVLNDQEQQGEALTRVQRFLDVVRALAKSKQRCLVYSQNHVPTKSGLASSASGFAALSVAANHLFAINLDPVDLSQLARIGSGSAARSIFGGMVKMHPGSSIDKTGGFAEPIAIHPSLDLRLIVVQCHNLQKSISSRSGMIHTSKTSPYYPAWVATHHLDLQTAVEAAEKGNFDKLGEQTEHSTLKMHATMLAAKPGFWYFEPSTISIMNHVRALRQQGAKCYFTMDAGPHVKVLCLSNEVDAIAEEFKNLKGIQQVTKTKAGSGAKLL